MTKRNMLRVARTPILVVVSALQPALFLILFRYVLGGAVVVPGESYVNFVVPAVFLEAVMIGSMTTTISIAQDMKSGFIDRLRSLPMSRSAVLAGRTLADLSRSVLSLALMVGLGLAVGFSFHAPIPSIIAGLFIVIAVRLRIFLDLHRDRHRGEGPRVGADRGHPALFHLDVREQRHRPHLDDAGLVATLRE